jgi:uncharacterized protein (TIGR03086 family)
MDPVTNLGHAFDIGHAVLRNVGSDAWSNQSPCTEWKARDVANHMIGGAKMLTGAVKGAGMDPAALAGDLAGSDPAASYKAATDEAMTALRGDPGFVGRTVKLPFGEMPGAVVAGLFTTDHFTHAWDVAKATGQNTDLDPQMAQALLGVAKQTIGPDLRHPGVFGPEQPARADSPNADQLAAYLGRTV